MSRASRRIFIIRNLKRSACSPELIFRAYVAFVRSILLYAFPSFCNLPLYLFKHIVAIEKRVFRIIDDNIVQDDLSQAASKCCESLFNRILSNSNHPLRNLFVEAPSTATISKCILRLPFAKTKRFAKSFIKICKRH